MTLYQQIREYAREHPLLNKTQLGEVFGVTRHTVRRAFEEPAEQKKHYKQKFEQPIVRHGNVAIASDLHVPLVDETYLEHFIQEASRRGIRILILAGDFLHCDLYGNYHPKQEGAGVDVERPMANKWLKRFLEVFDEVILIMGNHDFRYVKGRNYTIDFETCMHEYFNELTDAERARFTVSNLDHMYVWGGNSNTPWYVCHPRSYSRMPLGVAIKIAAIKGCHVLVGHSHHCAVGHAVNGVHVVGELGGFHDRHHTAYLQASTTFPVWQQGYAYIVNGKLEMHSPLWSTS